MLHAALDAQKQGYQGIVAVDACGGLYLSAPNRQLSVRWKALVCSSSFSCVHRDETGTTTSPGKRQAMFALLQHSVCARRKTGRRDSGMMGLNEGQSI